MKTTMLNASSLLVLAAVLGGGVMSAQAADLSAAPVYRTAPIVEAWNPWMIRVRALGVLPAASGSTVNVLGLPALSSPNSGLSIGNSIVPELDISYFFTRNIAAELILGVTKNSITGTGTLAGLNIGSTWLLPPTLMLQYHFTDLGAFKPYVGLGVNYTVFYNQSRRQYAAERPDRHRIERWQQFRSRRAGRLRLHARPPLGAEFRREEVVPGAQLYRYGQQRDPGLRASECQPVAGCGRRYLQILTSSERRRDRPGAAEYPI